MSASYSKYFPTHDEKIRFSKALDLIKKSERSIVFSDFFSISLFEKVSSIISKEGLCTYTYSWGGYPEAERKIFAFCGEETEDVSFPIICLKISFNKKFAKNLTHRDFLGSILGMGINRDKVGDIVVKEDCAYVFLIDEIADFLEYSLTKVGHVSVKVMRADEEADFFKPIIIPCRIMVSSLRLDSVISAGFKISRGKAAELVNSDKAYINWSLVSSPSKAVKVGDTITVRGRGRIEIADIAGKSKKEKILLDVIIRS